jgi:hypothetical protein
MVIGWREIVSVVNYYLYLLPYPGKVRNILQTYLRTSSRCVPWSRDPKRGDTRIPEMSSGRGWDRALKICFSFVFRYWSISYHQTDKYENGVFCRWAPCYLKPSHFIPSPSKRTSHILTFAVRHKAGFRDHHVTRRTIVSCFMSDDQSHFL